MQGVVFDPQGGHGLLFSDHARKGHIGFQAPGQLRHPSQLYEFALEGLALFTLLWLYSKKPRPVGAVSGLFLIGYGSFRFIAEFARTPDDGIFGLMTFGISMGQWLSLPMVLAGIVMMTWSYLIHKSAK